MGEGGCKEAKQTVSRKDGLHPQMMGSECSSRLSFQIQCYGWMTELQPCTDFSGGRTQIQL